MPRLEVEFVRQRVAVENALRGRHAAKGCADRILGAIERSFRTVGSRHGDDGEIGERLKARVGKVGEVAASRTRDRQRQLQRRRQIHAFLDLEHGDRR